MCKVANHTSKPMFLRLQVRSRMKLAVKVNADALKCIPTSRVKKNRLLEKKLPCLCQGYQKAEFSQDFQNFGPNLWN